MAKYAHPETLVDTNWVKANLGKPGIKLVEIDVDTKAYDAGHIPGSIGFNWQTQLQDQLRRDIISRDAFEKLVGGAGISPSDTVIVFGDNNNWFAAYGFWLFKIYGHKDVRLMNGGRVKWLNDHGQFGESGYFPGLEIASSPPLLYMVCPAFRFHSTFGRMARYLDPCVEVIQVGLNDGWREVIQVLFRRQLNAAG